MSAPSLLKNSLSFGLSGVLVLGAAGLGLALDPTVLPRASAAPAQAGAPLLHPDLPAYPGVVETPIGSGLRVNGQLVDMHQFFTNETPEKVADYYQGVFESINEKAVTRYTLGNATYVGLMEDSGRFVQVMMIRSGDGSTLVVPNVAAGPLRPGFERRELSLPLPDDNSNLMTFVSNDEAKKGISAQFITKKNLEEVGEFYKSALLSRGYTQTPGALFPKDMGENALMRFRNPEGATVSVGVQGLEAGRGTLVYLLEEKLAGERP